MLSKTLFLTGLRDLLRRPLQTGLMIVGVMLGVAVVIAIDLANTSANRAFVLSTEAVTGKATHQILGGPSGLPNDLYRQVKLEWGYRASAPVVTGVGIALDLDQQPFNLLGFDPIADAPFRNYLGQGAPRTAGFSRFYTDPNGVLIGIGVSERYGLKIGDSLLLQINGQTHTLTILGLLTPTDENGRRALDNLLLLDIAAAQNVLGQHDHLTRIDLILSADEAKTLAAQLPASTRLVPATAQADTLAQLTSAFQLNLTALSLLALVVGMFLIYNTMMFSVVQRRAVLGTLRALGVTPQQLFALIISEAAVASALGGLLGLGLGWVLGQGAVRLVTQTINDLYFVLSVQDAPLTWFTTLKGLGLGIGAGMLAAAAPALEAASVEPITMLRASSLESRMQNNLPLISLSGVSLIVIGSLVLIGITTSIVASFLGLFAVLLGLALLVPVLTVWLMRGATPGLTWLAGTLGRMAARTVLKALSRTSLAIAALMVAVSVTIGVSLMISSFRNTVVNWLDLTLLADIYISAPAAGGAQISTSLPSDLPQRVAAVPGVAVVETVRTVIVETNFGPTRLVVADSQFRRSASLYRFASGDPDFIWSQMRAGAVIVSEPFVNRHGLTVPGDSLTLHTDHGEQTLPIIAVYYDYASDQGAVMISRAVYEQYWEDRGLSGVAAYVSPGASPATVADALRTALSGTALQVQVNRALRDQALTVFDRTFAITNALRLLAVVVAFIGVLSALMALQIERTRELATLQALGLTPQQLWRLALWETGLMGAVAGLLSLPTGLVLAIVLIYVINLRSFGWTIQMELDAGVFAQALVISISAALLAAIYPARRLERISIAEGLRGE